MKIALSILSAKKIPECNILVGSERPQIRLVETKLGLSAEEVTTVDDSMLSGNKLYRVLSPGGIQIFNEKLLSRVGVWDASIPLEPDSLGVKEILEEACRRLDIKPDKDLFQSVQWKLFEGTGGIEIIENSILEAMQWLLLPPDPKPELPWFNPDGWFRLPQVHRELMGYLAFTQGDMETMKLLGTKERVGKWNLDPSGVERSKEILDGWKEGIYLDATARLLLKAVWEPRVKRKRNRVLPDNAPNGRTPQPRQPGRS